MTKRPHMSLKVQRDAALIAIGLDPENVEWNHSPPLAMRLWDDATGDTIPPANDPRHIVPMATADHREQTAKVDIPRIAKMRRISKSETAFRARLLAKAIGDDPPRDVKRSRIQSRGFDKTRIRKMNGQVQRSQG